MATTKAKLLAGTKRRIGRLITEAGGQAAFCRIVWPKESVDANKAKVSKWSRGAGLDPTQAIEVATAFGYRPAWLLFGELPERAGVTRDDATIFEDLKVEVERRLAADAAWERLVMFDVGVDGARAVNYLVAAYRAIATGLTTQFNAEIAIGSAIIASDHQLPDEVVTALRTAARASGVAVHGDASALLRNAAAVLPDEITRAADDQASFDAMVASIERTRAQS